MKSKMTNFKACGNKLNCTKKDHVNNDQNNKNLLLKKSWFLLIIIFVIIAIFSSIKESNDKLSSANFQSNKEKFEQSAKAAKSYWRFAPLYRDEIIEQLIYQGFTYEEAVYGLEENNY